MPENILVVEYEPRYTDRVKQALAGQPLVPSFARDGEEAIRALDGASPSLIVVSSVVPKISTADLIRAIRGRKSLADTPILLTVSGYNGKSPKSDAVRLGASDILPKPYSETEFLGKVQQLLGLDREATMRTWVPELDPGFTVRANPAADGSDSGQLTSNDIFGELLDDKAAAQPGARKMKPTDDLDKLLEDTLSGVRPQKKRDTVSTPAPAPAPAAPPPAAAKPKSTTASADLDKLLSDTLSGLDRTARPRAAPAPAPAPAAPQPRPEPPPPVASAPAAQPATTQKIPTITPEKIKVSTPVFTPPAPAAREEEEPADGIRFGQYVLIEKIATGGMAEVWKARMRGVEGFQKIVAIKKILPHLSDNQDFVEMFVDEAKLAAQLNHNNIIHIYDLGKIQNSYYIAMEYVDGHDLKTILRRGTERDQPMTVELALFIASKIAAALDYAHRKRDFEDREMGLVHRDVSPQNVLISQEGDIKLCDFGIAKAASKASHTQVGALKGKLQYMSPEQAQGQKVDRRSDIFALAAVLFEMLTNRKLFQGDNELSILEQVREARVKPPSQINDEVTPEIDAIVLKALQKDPASRYQTAGEMAKELDAVLYTFKPTPTSADLAIYMHRIWSADAPHAVVHEPEPVAEPKPVVAAPVPVPVAAPAPAPATSAPMFGYEEPAAGKKFPFVPVGIAAAVVVAILAVWLATRSSSSKAAAPVTTSAAKTATSPAATPATTSAATTTTPAAPAVTASNTTTTLDQAKIDEEVKKRLAAEKAKLDAQAKAQTTTQAPAAAATPPRPAPAQQQPAPQPQVAEQRPPAPAPVTPAPQPVAPAPQPVAQQPAPQPVAEVAKVKTGDLVQLGTEGLIPPKSLRRADPIYPQIARIERIEGLVIISALINENGQVIDTKLIRSVPRGGLNEAAEQSVRRSTFAPATKDGVRVKSWITITVNFKL